MNAEEKLYTISRLAMLSSSRRVLEGAVAPHVPAESDDPNDFVIPGEFGWTTGLFLSPFRDDYYLVSFEAKNKVRILAYLDKFGRAFTQDKASDIPPARDPDLMLAHEADDVAKDHERGWILVKNKDGTMRKLGRYHMRNGFYSVDYSWYDFGERANGLVYPDFMARLYFALVYRPACSGNPVPSSGLDSIMELLRSNNLVRSLRAIRLLVQKAEDDPALKAPALARLLSAWLLEAGFDDKTSRQWLAGYTSEDSPGPLRLIRTHHYANTFYVTPFDEDSTIDRHRIWALESALNRFLLIKENMGEHAAEATEAECMQWDEFIFNGLALQAPASIPPAGPPVGEWDVRESVGQFMERLRLPYRFTAVYHADVREGVAAISLVSPDRSLMPRWMFDRATDTWSVAEEDEREERAFQYAAHLGLALAACCFASSGSIARIAVTARPFIEGDEGDVIDAFYSVVFDRGEFTAADAYRAACSGDPRPFFERFSAQFGAEAQYVEPFSIVTDLPSYGKRADVPELATVVLKRENQRALGARDSDGLRIDYAADVRKVGGRLAHELFSCTSAQEAIHLVLEEQKATGSPRVFEACTRLMTALAQGTLRNTDTAGIADCFVGDDVFADAHRRASALAQTQPHEAARILRETIAEAEASGRYHDTPEAVHRMFDSYTSRVVYNLRHVDGGRKVELIPPSLFLCYFDALNLLDESFTQSEDAVAFGRRCIELAPTFTPAYRRCARAFMLVGDLESASNLLTEALEFALSADEIATAYYQLAYVRWRAGSPQAGLACYLKSIMTSPVYAAQASIELHELIREESVEAIERKDVDGFLVSEGIPLAPDHDLLDKLEAALHAAVNEELFAVARSLLSAYAHHRPDDALVNVMHSLEDPRDDMVVNQGGLGVQIYD